MTSATISAMGRLIVPAKRLAASHQTSGLSHSAANCREAVPTRPGIKGAAWRTASTTVGATSAWLASVLVSWASSSASRILRRDRACTATAQTHTAVSTAAAMPVTTPTRARPAAKPRTTAAPAATGPARTTRRREKETAAIPPSSMERLPVGVGHPMMATSAMPHPRITED